MDPARQVTTLDMSLTKLKNIKRARDNFDDFRQFLKERALVNTTAAKIKRDTALATAVLASNKANKANIKQRVLARFRRASKRAVLDQKNKTFVNPAREPIQASTKKEDEKEDENENENENENDRMVHALLQRRDVRRNTRRRRSRPPPAFDHESLNMLLHDAALDETHRKLEAFATTSKHTTSITPNIVIGTEWFLRIDVDGANGLRNADGVGDLSDPFVIVKLNGQEICKTNTVQDSLNPIWDFHKEIHITLKDLAPIEQWHDCTLDFEVFDEDYDNQHDFLGLIRFTGKNLMSLFESKKKSHTLQNRSEGEMVAKGNITVDVELIEKKTVKKIIVENDSDSDIDIDIDIDTDDEDMAESSSQYQDQLGRKIAALKTPTSSPLIQRTTSLGNKFSGRRSSMELTKSRRKASAISLKEMMAMESGDVSLSWLMSVPMFADLTPPEINALRDALVPEVFNDGEIIILEGDRNASKFYIIQMTQSLTVSVQSCVEIYKTIDGQETMVNTMAPGQTFGERALLIKGEARAATCKAKGRVTCLVLDRETFANMLASSTTLIDENYKPGRGNDPDAAGLTRHVERFSQLIKWFTLATEEGNRDNILEAGLCLELHKLFSPELRPKDIIERTISTMYSLFDCERVGLFLIDHNAQEMVLVVSATARYLTLPLTGIAGSVAKTGVFEIVRDAYRDPRFNQSMDKETGYRTRTMVACPLKNQAGEVVAVIQLINKKAQDHFSEIIQPSQPGLKKHNIKSAAKAIILASRFDRKPSAARRTKKIVDGSHPSDRRQSWLLESLANFKEKDRKTSQSPIKNEEGEDNVSNATSPSQERSGTTVNGKRGRGGRTLRGRSLEDARRRKRIEMDTASVQWPTFSQDDVKLLAKIAEQLEPVISNARAHKTEQNFKNLRKLDVSLLVEVQMCEHLRKFVRTGPKDKETGQRTGPVRIIPIPKGKKMEVTLALYHGEKMLQASCTSNAATLDQNGHVVFNEKLIHSCRLRCLPRATRLIFIVHKPGKGPDGTNKPVGWGGMSAMDFRDALVSGNHRLRLWSGPCLSPTVPILQPVEDEKAAGFLYLTFPDFGQEVRFYEVDDEELGETVQEIGMSKKDRKRAKGQRRESGKRFFVDLSGLSGETALEPELERIIYNTALQELSDKEQQTVWNARDRLTKIALSLPKVLLSVKWDQPHIVSEMHTLLYMWERMEPLDALQLLDSRFPDPKVRAYSVQLLDELRDDELRPFLLQLVQCLKHEAYHDSALSRFLVCRAVQSPDQIGHILYWLLKSEVHIVVVRDRFSLILAEYLRAVEPEVRTELGHQGFVMRRLVAIAKEVGECEGGKSARKKLLHERLRATALPATFQLPLSPDVICDGIRVEECRVMDSKKKPLWLVFDAIDWKAMHENYDGAPLQHFKFPVLFKAGDDLRQDQLTLQLLGIMDQLWKGTGMDLQLSPYACVATGDQIGFLEVVQYSTTMASVVKADTSLDRGKKGLMARFSAAKKAVYNRDYIKVWLEAEARSSMRTGIVHNPLLLSDRQHSYGALREEDNKPAATNAENLKQFNRRFMLS